MCLSRVPASIVVKTALHASFAVMTAAGFVATVKKLARVTNKFKNRGAMVSRFDNRYINSIWRIRLEKENKHESFELLL